MTDPYAGYPQPPQPPQPAQSPQSPYGQAPYAAPQQPYGQTPPPAYGQPQYAPGFGQPPMPAPPSKKKGGAIIVAIAGIVVGLIAVGGGIVKIAHAVSHKDSSSDDVVSATSDVTSTPTTPTTVKTPATTPATTKPSTSSNDSDVAALEIQTAAGHYKFSVVPGWKQDQLSGSEPEVHLSRSTNGDLLGTFVVEDATAAGQIQSTDLDQATVEAVGVVRDSARSTSVRETPREATLDGEDARLVQLEVVNDSGTHLLIDLVVTVHNHHVFAMQIASNNEGTDGSKIEAEGLDMMHDWSWKD